MSKLTSFASTTTLESHLDSSSRRGRSCRGRVQPGFFATSILAACRGLRYSLGTRTTAGRTALGAYTKISCYLISFVLCLMFLNFSCLMFDVFGVQTAPRAGRAERAACSDIGEEINPCGGGVGIATTRTYREINTHRRGQQRPRRCHPPCGCCCWLCPGHCLTSHVHDDRPAPGRS